MPSTRLYALLWKKNLPLIKQYTNKSNKTNSTYDLEDMLTIAMIRLQAVVVKEWIDPNWRFDVDKFIANTLSNAYRDFRLNNHVVPISRWMKYSKKQELQIMSDTALAFDESVAETSQYLENLAILETIASVANKRDWDIVKDRLKGDTIPEVARKLGVTRQTVHGYLGRLYSKFKERWDHVEEFGWDLQSPEMKQEAVEEVLDNIKEELGVNFSIEGKPLKPINFYAEDMAKYSPISVWVYSDLVESIRERGMVNRPIVNGLKIVHGRKRIKACKELGIRSVSCETITGGFAVLKVEDLSC